MIINKISGLAEKISNSEVKSLLN